MQSIFFKMLTNNIHTEIKKIIISFKYAELQNKKKVFIYFFTYFIFNVLLAF